MLAVNVHNRTNDKKLEKIFKSKLKYNLDFNHDNLEQVVVSTVKDTLQHWRCKQEIKYSVIKDTELCRESCKLCADPYKENQHITKLSCGHEFHRKCLHKWTYSLNYFTCPTCNKSICKD